MNQTSPPTITPIGTPTVLAMSAPGEQRWGFYQFPDIWRAPGGEIYAAMNVGHDTDIGDHEPSWFFVSRDNGKTWSRIAYEEVDQSPPPITFSDGSQVAFGKTFNIYHVHAYGPLQQPWQWWDCDQLGVEPIPWECWDGYDNNQWFNYRYEDFPATARAIPLRRRNSSTEAWHEETGSLDAPGLVLGWPGRARWWNEDGTEVIQDLPRRLFRMWPREVVVLPDDTLLWVYCSTHPATFERRHIYWQVDVFASTDRGRTWHRRGMVANDTDQTTDGYGGLELAIQVLPNGDVYCVIRTELGDKPHSSQYLAAARSTDNGFTWSKPVEIAPFSVTPYLMTLANGTVAVAYGRPGVYLRASADSAKTWSDALAVVGPTEAELLKDRWWKVRYDHNSSNKISCGNIGTVVTGPDRFLLAYSDFRHKNDRGEICKAVLVQEFQVK